ncbi:MAG: hypothetical protein QXU02_04300 [Candidatus Bathyarchaeia archaeon]
MIEDFVVALVAIFTFSMTIYVSGVMLSRRSAKNGSSKRMPYVCGERLASLTSRAIISPYKYIIFFIILDSSLVIIAFASAALNPFNIWFFSIYVLLLLISSTPLMEVVE